jgi:proline iminopeptidase
VDRLDSHLRAPLQPATRQLLAVGDGHQVHVETCGSAAGIPLLIVHGGPGGSINPYYRQLPDPARYRMILFDQRGCGRSTPFGGLHANTTQDLVADIERIRQALGIVRWVVLGGSWGSALALAYAQAHPARVQALVVTGVFLADQADIDWWWHGARALYPEVWQRMCDFLPAPERATLRASMLARVLDDDPAVHIPAVQAMLRYEVQTLDVLPTPSRLAGLLDSPNLIAMGRLHAHYERHRYFLAAGELLANAHRLAEIPGCIINGRFDGITPPRAAFELSRAWPKARLQIVPIAGHGWNDPILSMAISHALDLLAASGLRPPADSARGETRPA